VGVVRLFRLPREEYNHMIRLFPGDEDMIFQNLSTLSEDDKVGPSLCIHMRWMCVY
jgi:hypothetical protein